ncbi:MAG: serine hydrolase [Flavobacteriaceae bacterium]|nr:serine hydrolase [Flavobacteriaceae bacterium]
MENQSIGNNLIYQRKLKGYSQQELSEKTQVTVRTIQRIEKGEVNPHLQTVKLLATALSIEVEDLMVLDNPKEESIKTKWLLLIHGTPLLGLAVPFCNVLFPLFLWIHKRDDNPIYDRHGAKVINFQITALILFLLSFIALITVQKWGFIMFISILPLTIIIVLVNIIMAVKNHKCYYPFSLPILKPKKKIVAVVALFLSMSFSFSCDAQNEQIVRLDGSEISVDSLKSKLKTVMKEANVPGLAVTIFNGNEPIFQKTMGYKSTDGKLPLTDSTNLYGASLSKAVFGVLVMKLIEEGVIDLDTPLESYLPKKIYEYEPQTRWHDDYSDLKEDSLYPQITARMCLAHITRFPNWRFFEPDQKLRVTQQPGSRYQYSGEGFVYLQVVLEKLTGKGLEELAKEYVFGPLKMHNSSYEWKPEFEDDFAVGHNSENKPYQKDTDNEPRSGSTLETTAEDYTKFLTAVLNKKLISEESYTELFKPQIRIKGKNQFGPGAEVNTDENDKINLSYGLGWGYFETPYGKAVFKEGNGSGFQHYTILFPEADMGLMILTNSDNGTSIYQIVNDIAIKNIYTPWEWQGYESYERN